VKYIGIIITLVAVTYGQLAIKHAMYDIGPMSSPSIGEAFKFYSRALINPWVITGLGAAILAALSWMATLSKFELSAVYPILSLNFVLVPVASMLLFQEAVNAYKMIGIAMICLGVFIFSRGM